MTVPPPPPSPNHKLIACTSRLTHHLERTRDYVAAVLPALPEDDDDPKRQFFFQTMVLMAHTFMEEYFRCVVSLATYWNAPAVRQYLAQQDPKQADKYSQMPAWQLTREVGRFVRFSDEAAALKGLFALLTTASPFADEWAEATCLDLVAVRNIITHQGGWATKANVPTVKSAHVIVKTVTIGQAEFYDLRLDKQFIVDTMAALTTSSIAIDAALRDDPRYAV